MNDWKNTDHILEGTTAIVTGSTRGIGAVIAKQLASVGSSVVVGGRTLGEGKQVVDSINEHGGEAVFRQTDVRNPDDLRQLTETAINEFGGIDILVNNAAFETDTSPAELNLDTWDAILETDFRAYWLTAKYAYPSLVESDHGSIVNIGSHRTPVVGTRLRPLHQ